MRISISDVQDPNKLNRMCDADAGRGLSYIDERVYIFLISDERVYIFLISDEVRVRSCGRAETIRGHT